MQVNPHHVSLDRMHIWMGKVQFKDKMVTSWRSTIKLTNHTFGKVVATWIPGWYQLLVGKLMPNYSATAATPVIRLVVKEYELLARSNICKTSDNNVIARLLVFHLVEIVRPLAKHVVRSCF